MTVPGRIGASLTQYGRMRFLQWLMGPEAGRPPASVFFGFCTARPMTNGTASMLPEVPTQWSRTVTTGDGIGGTSVETTVVATGYRRVAYPFDGSSSEDWLSPAPGMMVNGKEIVWPQAVGDWPGVVSWVMCDSASGGYLLAWGDIEITVREDDVVVFPASGIQIGFVAVD